ncbi:cell invasion protein [Salmonella enterica subsp. arizonae]|uniref:Cell invasion protein n=1 Tax=Salmonella enterica subsp. arizonae TaxID=59203 RepID=A0A379T674_SALER|nr:cell invasion protein [Salmonella enterica subsp. arizonae]
MRSLLQASSLIYLPIAFFIPLDHGGVNFEIQVDTDAAEIILHELKEGKAESRPVQLNTPIQVGELLILIRPESEPWAPEQPKSLEASAKKIEPRFKKRNCGGTGRFVYIGAWDGRYVMDT